MTKRWGPWLLVATLGIAACGGSAAPPSPEPSPTPVPDPGSPALRVAAEGTRRLIGAAINHGPLGQEPLYAQVAGREFDYVTAEYEMKWDPIQRVRGTFDFGPADQIVAFARQSNMKVKGHALIWHAATPAWVSQLSADELRSEMENHIRTVMGHYQGQVVAWDVVNEALADDGLGLRDTVFRQKLGDGYVALAFRLARQADPSAQLIYNDYSAEGSGAKSDAVYALVQRLKQDGVPIDGVGLQMHISASSYPRPSDIAANMRRLAQLGLTVNISEMDVRIRDLPGSQASRLETQRQVYHDVVAVCVAEPACQAVTLWGVSDAHSWVDATFGPDDPLLFDEQYRPKPAYLGVRDALLGK